MKLELSCTKTTCGSFSSSTDKNWPRRYDDGRLYLPVVSRTATSRLQSLALIITLDLPEARQQKYTTTLIMGRESLPGAYICRQPLYLPLPTINVVCNS